MGKATDYRRRYKPPPRRSTMPPPADTVGPGGVRPSEHACQPGDITYGIEESRCGVCGRQWRYQLASGQGRYGGRIWTNPITKEKPRG